MRRIVFVFAILLPSPASAEWKAPPNADPTAIFVEAGKDTWAGRHEEALAKYLWLYQHKPEKATVVYAWHSLGEKYPPALEKLKEARDAEENKATSGEDKEAKAFQIMASINEFLDEEDRTAAVFIRLDRESPEAAKRAYHWAQPALVSAKEFAVCNKYLDPEAFYSRMAMLFEYERRYAIEVETQAMKRMSLEGAEIRFLNQSATLIALLVLNDRKPEAEKIAQSVREMKNLNDRDSIIDKALEGNPPPPLRKVIKFDFRTFKQRVGGYVPGVLVFSECPVECRVLINVFG